jgi:hypothetical protein
VRKRTRLPAGAPTRLEAAILDAVLYAAVFEFPLTPAEVHRALLGVERPADEVRRACEGSAWLRARLDRRDGLIFPRGRECWVAQRRAREARSRAFLQAHRPVLRLFCALPFVRLLALSGSLAHLNGGADADLDLFIVTRGRRVWCVTLAIVLLAKLLRRRRIVCANFVLADSRLALEQQDLFAASQAIHLKPLVGGDALRVFLDANPFVAALYPNARAWPTLPIEAKPGAALRRLKRALEVSLAVPSMIAEPLCRWAYGRHLRREVAHATSPEQVRLGVDVLKLHTRSHRRPVLERYDELRAEAAGEVVEPGHSGIAV